MKIGATIQQDWVIKTVIFALIFFLFIYKLHYHYFFTDEVLYIDSGREHLKGIYDSTMQVPLLPKYIAALMYKLGDHNVFLLRLPFALMGILSSFLIYKILQEEINYKWGLIGALLFSSSVIIYDSTRMVMLEPLMHLTWLFFLYFLYKAIKHNKSQDFLFAGISLGLALASKITSLLLVPFSIIFLFYSLLHRKISVADLMYNYLLMYTSGAFMFLITYSHAFLKAGERLTIERVLESVKKVYLSKSTVGKPHLINGILYTKSPVWAYAYFLYAKEGIIRFVIYIIGLVSSVFCKNLFVLYWGIFFLMTFIFHQISGVKNLRYTSTFEIPLIILVVRGFFYLSRKFRGLKNLFVIIFAVLLLNFLSYIVRLNKTGYYALFDNYLREETSNFEADVKVYLCGSSRSNRWYKHGKGEGKKMFEISKDYVAHCPHFSEFNYLVFDKNEIERYGDNLLYQHALKNQAFYSKIDLYNFYIFKKTVNGEMSSVCRWK